MSDLYTDMKGVEEIQVTTNSSGETGVMLVRLDKNTEVGDETKEQFSKMVNTETNYKVIFIQ